MHRFTSKDPNYVHKPKRIYKMSEVRSLIGDLLTEYKYKETKTDNDKKLINALAKTWLQLREAQDARLEMKLAKQQKLDEE